MHAREPSPLRVEAFATSRSSDWDGFVARCEDATFCHLLGWQRVVERTWGHRPHHLMAVTDAGIQAVLPLFHVRSVMFGSMLVSTPNAVYGGVAGVTPAARRVLSDEAARVAADLKVDFLELCDCHTEAEESGPGL